MCVTRSNYVPQAVLELGSFYLSLPSPEITRACYYTQAPTYFCILFSHLVDSRSGHQIQWPIHLPTEPSHQLSSSNHLANHKYHPLQFQFEILLYVQFFKIWIFFWLTLLIHCSFQFFLANDTMMIFGIHELWVISIFLQIKKTNISCENLGIPSIHFVLF